MLYLSFVTHEKMSMCTRTQYEYAGTCVCECTCICGQGECDLCACICVQGECDLRCKLVRQMCMCDVGVKVSLDTNMFQG